MNTKTIYLFRSFTLCVLLSCILSCNKDTKDHFPELVKVSLREVGHQLLLTNGDTTSVVSPVIALDENKFQVTFENTLSIQPDSLVAIIKRSFEKADLPQHYITEVTQCEDFEVAYSYAMQENAEKGIIPCRGRELKKGCYQVAVQFTEVPAQNKTQTKVLYILFLVFLLLLVVFSYRRTSKQKIETDAVDFTALGRFKFYPEQNKLIKEATEISLSKKECELLALFVAQPNQVIKREELTKKVWEDKGVIVGRSLDTYISKLRNKLKEDSSIKIINVHGVGYKLEVH
ncbi:MAG: winged helix-turn-helix transcriptional regulator [Oceanihabitans sp.]|nr:winged helix-turn-helix transcriptional regulator [Oceanihabitans sp.]